MAKLIYAANVSLDGYIEDERGNNMKYFESRIICGFFL